jgi:diphthamide biosynthesis protein 7
MSDSDDDILCGLADDDFMGIESGSDDDDEEEEEEENSPPPAPASSVALEKPKYRAPKAPPSALKAYVSSWPTTESASIGQLSLKPASATPVVAEMPAEGSLLAQRRTDHFADSVEFCPHGGSQDKVVCGTYQLDQSSGWRVGSLALYQLNSPAGGSDTETSTSADMLGEVTLMEAGSVLETSAGVLDIKWSHQKIADRSVIGMVASDGTLQCFELASDTAGTAGSGTDDATAPTTATSTAHGCCLAKLASSPPLCENSSSSKSDGNDTIFLSLDWNNRRTTGQPAEVVVSDNKGGVGLWSLSDAGLQCTRRWSKIHSLDMHSGADAGGCEVWITAFDSWHPQVFFSGGEDAVFKGWDLRQPSGGDSGGSSTGGDSPVFVNSEHTCGVCSIHSHPFR